MKFLLKTFSILLFGLMVAVVIYPVLHELGHILLAVVLGIRIEEINLLSGFSILCMVNATEKAKIILIGYGGILFPIIVSFLIKPKKFILWYVVFTLKIINILSIVYYAISLISYIYNNPFINDDISTMLEIDNMSFSLTALLLVLCFIMMLLSFIKDKPFKHFDKFYYVEE